MASVARRVFSAAGWILVAVLVYLAWPAALGGHLSLVVVSGHSMDGTYRSGDLVMAWPHADYHVGEIVVYKIPKGEPASGLRVVHRIIEKKDGHFTSQGDNRTTPDFWRPTVHDVVGHPFLRIRGGGLALKWLISPIALALLCGVCVYCAVVGKDDAAQDSDGDDAQDDESAYGETEDGDVELDAEFDDGELDDVDEDAAELEPSLSR